MVSFPSHGVRLARIAVAACLVACFGGGSASAATVTWDGGAGTTDWTTAANWSGDAMPSLVDDVVVGPGARVKLPADPDLRARSLRVNGGSLTGEYRGRLWLDDAITVQNGGTIHSTGSLRSFGGTSSIDATSTWHVQYGTTATQSLTNAGTIDIDYLASLSAEGTFTQSGKLTGNGSMSGSTVIDTGTSDVRTYVAGSGTLATSTLVCELGGNWRQLPASSLTIRPYCRSRLTSFTQDAGATLRITLTSNIRDNSNPEQDWTPLNASTAVLNGGIVVDADWGSSQSSEVRDGSLVKTYAGSPTISVMPAVSDGPGTWTGITSVDSGRLRVRVTETSVPTATGPLERVRCGSSIRVAWPAATDPETAVAYRIAVDHNASTVPGDATTIDQPEYAEQVDPGSWYVHVRPVDQAGNLGPTVHAGPWSVFEYGWWDGNTSDWTDASNWAFGVVPEPGADINVNGTVGPRIATDTDVGCVHSARMITIDAGATLTTDSIELQGPEADLAGGAVSAPRLVISSGDESGPTLGTDLRDVRDVEVFSSALRLASIAPGGSLVMGSANVVVDGPIDLVRLDQNAGSLTTPSITLRAGSSASLNGRIIADTLAASGSLVATGRLDVGVVRQLGDATARYSLDPLSDLDTLQVDGGTAELARTVPGDIVAAGGSLSLSEASPPRVGPIADSLELGAAAAVVVNPDSVGTWSIAGHAKLDGTIRFDAPLPMSPYHQARVLLDAAGGVSGTPRPSYHEFQELPLKLVRTATTIGAVWNDLDLPVMFTLEASLQDPEADGTRTATVTWESYDDWGQVAGVSFAIDHEATSTPDDVIDSAQPVGSTTVRLAPGTWYVHMRARDGAGNWSAVAHRTVVVVDPPPPPPPTDRCSNVTGVQATVPTGFMAASDGMCIRLGSATADIVYGSTVRDIISAKAGNDVVRARGGNDSVDGGAGNDRLFGDAGHDRLVGGFGADVLSGGLGNDTLIGGAGRDSLLGGAGADVISARDGVSLEPISCGTGRDVVYLDRRDRPARDCEIKRYR